MSRVGHDARDPLFSILTAVLAPAHDTFEATVRAVLGQDLDPGRGTWEWVLVDGGADPWVGRRLARLASEHGWVTVVRPAVADHAPQAADALVRARGEFVVLLDSLAVPDVGALSAIADAADADDDLDVLYGDHDRTGVDGTALGRIRTPEWSPERLRHHDYPAQLSVLRRSLAVEVGGLPTGTDDPGGHDLRLRVTERARRIVHLPQVLSHHREPPGTLAGEAADGAGDAAVDEAGRGSSTWDAGVRAVQRHLDRVGIRATAARGRSPHTYRVIRAPDLGTPTSIVVPTIGSRGPVGGVERVMVLEAVRSVLQGSRHRALEVVVVYDPPTPTAVLDQLRSLTTPDRPVRLVEFTEPFNFSRKCNLGALHAVGTNLVFLNDDVQAVSPGVPEQLTAPLTERDVGATGAKLLFEDGRIQHAGVVFGDGRVAHSFYRAGADEAAQSDELWTNREVSALTGACLAVRRDRFEDVGGFNETLAVNYNDVDLSLKLRRAGGRLVWLHDVVLHHFESVSRDSTVHDWETALLMRRWGDPTRLPERLSMDRP